MDTCSQHSTLDQNRRLWHFGIAVAAITWIVIIYSNSFQGSWQYDDFPNIVHNQRIHISSLTIKSLYDSMFVDRDATGGRKLSRPLANLTFALNYIVCGKRVWGYHLVNLLIHVMATAMLYLVSVNLLCLPLVRHLGVVKPRLTALVATLFWATHPIQVTAVTYIVQRMASMAGLFYLIGIFAYLKGRTGSDKRRRVFCFIGCALAYAAALATKENSAMMPMSLLLVELTFLQKADGVGWKKTTGLTLAAVALVVGVAFVFANPLELIAKGFENRQFTVWQRMLTQPRVLFLYIGYFLAPMNSRLALLHDVAFSSSLWFPATTLPALVGIFAIFIILCRWVTMRPLLAFGGLFFLLNHAIESSFVNLELIYEHRNYIPSMFLFLPLSAFFCKWLHDARLSTVFQRTLAGAATVLLLSQAQVVYTYNKVFRNEVTLWQDVILKSPELSLAHMNLGKVLWNKGLFDLAFQYYCKSYALNNFKDLRQKGVLHYNLGLFYLRPPVDYRSALLHFNQAIEYLNGFKNAYYQKARVLLDMQRGQEAEAVMKRAVDIWAGDVVLLKSLAVIRIENKELEGARQAAIKAMRIKPDWAAIFMVLGEIDRKSGNCEDAISHYQRYVKKKPNDPLGELALIELYNCVGDIKRQDEAARQVTRRWGIGPDSSYDMIFTSNTKFFPYHPNLPLIRTIITRVSEGDRD